MEQNSGTKLTEAEVNRYVHEFAGRMVFYIEAIGEITKGIIDHTTATRRAAPIVTEYLNDILYNLNNSHVVPIQPIHFHPYEMDPRQVMMSRYQSSYKGIIRK